MIWDYIKLTKVGLFKFRQVNFTTFFCQIGNKNASFCC